MYNSCFPLKPGITFTLLALTLPNKAAPPVLWKTNLMHISGHHGGVPHFFTNKYFWERNGCLPPSSFSAPGSMVVSTKVPKVGETPERCLSLISSTGYKMVPSGIFLLEPAVSRLIFRNTTPPPKKKTEFMRQCQKSCSLQIFEAILYFKQK